MWLVLQVFKTPHIPETYVICLMRSLSAEWCIVKSIWSVRKWIQTWFNKIVQVPEVPTQSLPPHSQMLLAFFELTTKHDLCSSQWRIYLLFTQTSSVSISLHRYLSDEWVYPSLLLHTWSQSSKLFFFPRFLLK